MASDIGKFEVSISLTCYNDVENVISESGLFNGLSEFLYSAIRDFYASCTRRFGAVLREIVQDESDSGVYHRFVEAMLDYGSVQFESYSNFYPGPNIKQIAIRPNDSFYNTMDSLSKHLFRIDDPDRIKKTCRIAIYRHVGNIRGIIDDYSEFETKLNELKSSANNGKIIIRD